MINILIVDDNEKIRKLIEIYLKREGFQVFHSEDGEVALEVMDKTKIDLMIVDVMMPKKDGYELVKELREANYTLPILMVTAKDTYPDKKMGFDLGVDDYMTKPIDMDELILRINALFRRSKIFVDKEIVLGNLTLDLDNLEVKTHTESVLLPKKEFYLLYKLLSYPNKILTRQELMDDIWGYDSEADERTVDVHIKRLREKFKEYKEFEIVTIRGLGYKGVHKI
jgi:DNA-binding response OmpR family regulator